jgi:hypothetical protein
LILLDPASQPLLQSLHKATFTNMMKYYIRGEYGGLSTTIILGSGLLGLSVKLLLHHDINRFST